MKIVIDVEKADYELLMNGEVAKKYLTKDDILGTLPKGHGRIVDISKIDKDKIEASNPIISLIVDGECIEAVSLDYLDNLPTIIEAESEE